MSFGFGISPRLFKGMPCAPHFVRDSLRAMDPVEKMGKTSLVNSTEHADTYSWRTWTTAFTHFPKGAINPQKMRNTI
jgi:hypothetical protein